ncbi:hypothetical protein BJG92_03109 [Arthrobacter sp. SO5]|nr:hypothetical protein [Arthrobacter sp. SO5]
MAKASSWSLIQPRKTVSSFFRPMPYGSLVKVWSEASLKASGSLFTKPARMTLSVVIASTCLLRSGSRQAEYVAAGTRTAPYFSTMVPAGVEPVTEQTFLPFTSSGLVMDVLSLFTIRAWPAS